ncbi:hypothetical protein THITH_05235 [Thioalkalivibrio paradoxus ARh 1]|uniref:Uncharacterized protein n=1 Tax=Thioalkalivibrio paradoxus ARh 1 TaxID=713585 RepID=W0DN01_9GAMM|nr:hypothetical protein THITH_05235 [Thioalkalivibrio paradoxus ARh 1]
MPTLVWVGVLGLLAFAFTAQPAQAEVREHILLARQVGLSMTQGLVILIGHETTHVRQQSPCRYSGHLVLYDHTHPENPTQVGDPVPFSLAAGQSIAIPEVQPIWSHQPHRDSEISQAVFEIRLVSERWPPASCGNLGVTVFGWDANTKATVFQAGGSVEWPPASIPGGRVQQVSLGFLGLGPRQTGRVHLAEWTDFNTHDPGIPQATRCDFSGEIIAETIPEAGSPDARPSFRQGYPVKWVEPSTAFPVARSAIVDITPSESADSRSELQLTFAFNSTQPSVCLDLLSGSLQVVDTSTSETRTHSSFKGKYRPQFYLRSLNID